MLRVLLRAVATAHDPRFFPEALRACRNAGQALELYLESSAQFSYQSCAPLLLHTLRRLRLPAPQSLHDALTEVSLPQDARYLRLLQDLAAQHEQMTLDVLLDTCVQASRLSPLPAQLQLCLVARLKADKSLLEASPHLLSRALRFSCSRLNTIPESRELIKDLVAALRPQLPFADAVTTTTALKSLKHLPAARKELVPLLQPLFLKHLSSLSGKDLGMLLESAHNQHWLTPDLLEEGLSSFVGKLHSLAPSEIAQLLRIYLIYVEQKPPRDVQRVPEQCVRALMPSIRTCSAPDLLFILGLLPQFNISTAHYYELLSVEVVRLLPHLSFPDLVSAAGAMASGGLKSVSFVRRLADQLRVYLRQETNLTVDPLTHSIMSAAKAALLPELAKRKTEVKQLSLSTAHLLELMWALAQLSVRVETVPLHGEEWRAMLSMLREGLKPPAKLTFRDYERLTQVAWFNRNYFPTLPKVSASQFLSAFQLDSDSLDVKLDS